MARSGKKPVKSKKSLAASVSRGLTGNEMMALQALVGAHTAPAGQESSVIGEIIRSFRPSRHVSLDPLFNSPPKDFETADILTKIESVVSSAKGSVGCLQYRDDQGQWQPSTTAFRIGPAGGRLVATAGHALIDLRRANTRPKTALPFSTHGDLRDMQVNFNDDLSQDPATNLFPVARIRACHSVWDLLVLELGENPANAPLPAPLAMEQDPDWGEFGGNRVVVLGYPYLPVPAPGRTHDGFPAAFGSAPITGLHAAPGLMVFPRANRDFSLPLSPRFDFDQVCCRHDASTLPGCSGAPVLSIETGKVVALHVNGGSFEVDDAVEVTMAYLNRCVNLRAALLEEPRLTELMVAGGTDADITALPALTWSPAKPCWHRRDCGPGQPEGISPAVDDGEDEVASPFRGVVPDRLDFRDYFYEAGLATLPEAVDPRARSYCPLVRDQGVSRACTGFALAAAIECQLFDQHRQDISVSPRMLYECAKLYDEWIDRAEGGSSLRGAIKGFFQNGVCRETFSPWPDRAPAASFEQQARNSRWMLTRDIALNARGVALGGYFRVPPELLAFQAALKEVGSVLVSAHVHRGWDRPSEAPITDIPYPSERRGAPAFVLVGYDSTGFIIQNSCGASWSNWGGIPGLAHWRYADWAENLIDAWVIRLAPPHPETFDLRPRIAAKVAAAQAGTSDKPAPALPVPRRHSLIGHIVQSEGDGFVSGGALGAGLDALRETALYLATDEARQKYRSIAFVLWDPFLGADALARIAGALVEPAKARKIYLMHVLHGLSEVETLRLRVLSEAAQATERYAADPAALSEFIARRARLTTRGLWQHYLDRLSRAVAPGGPVWVTLASLLIEAGDRRGFTLCSIGSAAATANALDRGGLLGSFPARFKRHVMIAPTIDGPAFKALDRRPHLWRLPPAKPDAAEIPGFRGDWPDLVTQAYLPAGSLARRTMEERLLKTVPDLPATSIVSAFEEQSVRDDIVAAL